MNNSRENYCTNCFSLIPAELEICPACGERMAQLSAQDYRIKLLHALAHPLDDVRMRAIIAIGLRREAGTALPLAECALRHPANVVEGMQVVQELKDFATPEGVRALAILADSHAAHAVREAAAIAMNSWNESVH